MGTYAFIPERIRVLQTSALLLLSFSLACCASPVSPPPKSATPGEVRSSPARTIRAIISFRQPVANSRELTEAVAAACNCKPVFFRAMAGNALIYVISLPQEQDFAVFGKTLLRDASRFGIVAVEQDHLERF